MEKTVSYETKNTYNTLNELSPTTENIWFVFHGMGYLSRYFLNPFAALDNQKNYIIAPQAPSKYYLNDEFKYVGASWLTKENTRLELQNVLRYADGVFENEQIPDNKNLILFGFSQGVSIVCRWLAHSKIHCNSLVLYAGSIPNELKRSDFDFPGYEKTKVKIVYGDNDKYLTEERLILEKEKMDAVFAGNAEVISFKGGHEVKTEILKQLV